MGTRPYLQFSRRDALRLLGAGSLLAAVPSVPLRGNAQAAQGKSDGKAKAVIQIWMWGGPSHTDTFDPKPEAGYDYCGPFDKAISTQTPGLQVNRLMPLLAAQSRQYSVIRSMTHGIYAHETASYAVQTGRKPGERLVYPCTGAVVSLFKGKDAMAGSLIPPYVVLIQPQGRFSENGFLPERYRPFATGGDPAQARFAVEGIVAPGISDQRQRDRRQLLHQLNTLQHAMDDDPSLKALDRAEQQAYELILGDAGKVFDLAQETGQVRDRYGRNTFGQSCLAARRLVERGVPYVTINYGGWDTHVQNFQVMRQKLPQMDQGLATLLADLSDRGLLDTTIVWWSGEFGRTPKVMWEAPWNGGRNHWGACFCAMVAGGGFQGGRVLGSSDAKGEEVKDRPVYPADLIGTVYELLGIDLNAKLPNPQGLDLRVVPTPADNVPMAGRLKELV
ncbi:MAG: DUF1501 domain-containing protein [Bryobacteraceae bacterium]